MTKSINFVEWEVAKGLSGEWWEHKTGLGIREEVTRYFLFLKVSLNAKGSQVTYYLL